MSPEDQARLDAKAADVAATFNRVMHQTNDAPLTVEKVVMLQITRELLEEFKTGGGLILDNLPAVEASLDGIEQECRAAGLFEQYADLSRAERRRLAKLRKG